MLWIKMSCNLLLILQRGQHRKKDFNSVQSFCFLYFSFQRINSVAQPVNLTSDQGKRLGSGQERGQCFFHLPVPSSFQISVLVSFWYWKPLEKGKCAPVSRPENCINLLNNMEKFPGDQHYTGELRRFKAIVESYLHESFWHTKLSMTPADKN